MRRDLWDPQRASVPDPGEVVAYLRRQGWVVEKRTAEWAELGKDLNGERVIVEVPLKAGARDYPRVFATFLEDLSRLEAREPAAVLRDIQAAGAGASITHDMPGGAKHSTPAAGELLLYQTEDGRTRVEVRFAGVSTGTEKRV